MEKNDFFCVENTPMKVRVDVATHHGKEREENQDSFSINERTRKENEETCEFSQLYALPLLLNVCDGIGGESDGQLSAQIATKRSAELVLELFGTAKEDIAAAVNRYAQDANNKIRDMLKRNCHTRGGSTFAMLYLCGGIAFPFSLGDSRIYTYLGGELRQITEDHTSGMAKYRMNLCTLDEAKNGPYSHILTRYLGADVRGNRLFAQEYPTIELIEGMTFLLCSDGLYDMCSDNEISEVLGSRQENYAAALLDRAMNNGGMDNITCVTVRIGSQSVS